MICLRCKEEIVNLGEHRGKGFYSCACGFQRHALNIYHPSDPASPNNELWHFVYLDGMAEDHNQATAIVNGWEWAAPDLCCVDVLQETLAPGEYDCLLYGKPAIAIISNRFERPPYSGRIVLKEDAPENIAFNRNTANWR